MTSSKGSGDRRHDRGEVCPDCGLVHERCLGHARHSNDERRAAAREKWGTDGPWPCMRPPAKGLEVCVKHGGATPQAKAAGAARVEEARVLGRMGRLMAEAGAEVDDLADHEAFLSTIRRVRRCVWALDRMVGEMDGVTGHDRFGQDVAHPLVVLHHKYLTLLGGLEEGALRLGLDVRRQQFHEAQVAQIGAAITTLVTGLGHQLDDPAVVPVVESALALLASTQEAA